MIRTGRQPRTAWPRRIARWANTYALNVTLTATILATYSLT